jgi:O-antigen/teichoic acid export membrane protein
VFFLIILKWGIVGALLAQVISYGLLFLIIFTNIFTKIRFIISKNTIVLLIKFGFPLIFSRSGDIVNSTMGLYFLSFFVGLEKVGIFSLAAKISAIVSMVLILPFQLAYEPFVFSQLNNPDIKKYISKIATYLLIVYYIITFFIVFIFRDLINIIAPPEYSTAYNIIFLLLPISALMGFQYIGQSLLLIKNKTNISGLIIGFTSIFSICLNYFFIKQFGVAGIIIVNNLNALLITILLFIFGLRVFKIELEKLRILILILIFALMMYFIFQIQAANDYIFYSIPILLFILSFIFMYLLNFFDKNEKKLIVKSFSRLKYAIIHKKI